jgi:hypothetical protein
VGRGMRSDTLAVDFASMESHICLNRKREIGVYIYYREMQWHRLNMELDLLSLLGLLHAPVYSCTYWLDPRNSPPLPAFGLIYEGAIGQSR